MKTSQEIIYGNSAGDNYISFFAGVQTTSTSDKTFRQNRLALQ